MTIIKSAVIINAVRRASKKSKVASPVDILSTDNTGEYVGKMQEEK